ncbi:uncharacterized protein STEHIDRAFT_130428 [Stereum hirsutum FP-91666 SS1]|uniref:uncharacterized protein n=1 Tax=Stereum hirsutum (strain FP-91666) TaxID=721885 RepID=UPI000440F8E4|nr:uncharacterized protein STEHIDRAFT_130428 [Stereum hirsutum FP-91666 SS1]EIM88510.1 hypothetical protein STEHIDRAFT_130428 [Stereum hirsutum FP-91666 SS1]
MESPEFPLALGSSSSSCISTENVTPTSVITEGIANEASSSTVTSSPHETPIAETGSESNRSKRKRNRTVLRKQQCDRGQPCSRCVSRGAAKSCTYQEPKKNARNSESPVKLQPTETPSPFALPPGEVNERVLELESIISHTLNSLDPTAVAGLNSLLHSVQARYASGVVTDLSAESCEMTEEAVGVAATALGQLSQISDATPLHSHSFDSPDCDLFASARRMLPTTGSASLFDLRNNFPSEKIMSFLISHYFDHSSVHWIWPVINRPSFELCYRTFQAGAPIPPSIEYSSCVAIVCALALQFLPESDDDKEIFAEYEPGRHVLEQKLLVFVRSVMLTAPDPPVSSIERIQMVLLYAIYQWNEGKVGESYYILCLGIRMAQTLGMHRDGLNVWHMRPRDAELRRRVWWCLFIADRFQAFQFGCPYIISELHCDAELPMNLDQSQILDISPLNAKPIEEPTDSMYLHFHSRFSQLVGRMCDECFGAHLPTYRTVMDYEDKLRGFDWDIPNSLKYQSSQVAAARPYLSFQHQILSIEIYFSRLTLLRPFLFIRPEESAGGDEMGIKLNAFHRHARTVCLMLCKRLLSMAYVFRTQIPRTQQRWWAISGSAVHAAIVFTVAILSDPQNHENEELSEWIAFACRLLQELAPYNVVAQCALRYTSVMQNRTQLALKAAGICSTMREEPDLSLTQNSDRATRVLAQPQPNVADLLGRELAADNLWVIMRPGVFAGHFPGIASVSGPMEPQHLERFFDNCFTASPGPALPPGCKPNRH